MPTFTTRIKVPHQAEQMFALVSDIERYPEFVPMCEALVVRSQREKDGKTLLMADMTVGYKLIRETFTTQVYLQPESGIIDVKYIDGPFNHLENRWSFLQIEGQDACDVEFFIDYEFKSRMLAMVMGSVFDIAFRRTLSAFEKRANEIYGKSGAVA